MNVDDLKKFYKVKSPAELARKLSRPRSTIHYWIKGGIPFSTQTTFEVLSEGKLKADRHPISA